MTKAKRATSKKRARDPIAGQLTAQQEAFCQHYALNQAGSEAFSVAFPERAKGKTPQYRAEQASKLLAQSKIKTRISALATRALANAEKKFDISVDRVLQEFAAIAFYKADDYFEWRTVERAVYHKGEPVLDRNGEQVFEHVPQLKIRDSKTLTPEQIQAHYAATVRLSSSPSGNNLVLSWPFGTLQQADQVNGPFSDLLTATSPYTNAPTGLAKFYRVKVQ